MRKKKIVPLTTRYCFYCECIRKFEYNVTIMHSECIDCGNRASLDPNSFAFKHFNDRIKALHEEIKDLEDTRTKRQKKKIRNRAKRKRAKKKENENILSL